MASRAHRAASLATLASFAVFVAACSGTDRIDIGEAPPDAGLPVAAMTTPQDTPMLPDAPHMDVEDAGQADFTKPIAPVDPGVGTPPPPQPPVGQTDPVTVLRDACVQAINVYRKAAGVAPLARWSNAEACVDAQAHVDANVGGSHRTFQQCTELAQNECPNWPGATGAQALGTCLQTMWNGQPNGSHFRNMMSTRWTHVACGLYQAPSGRWWLVQNYR